MTIGRRTKEERKRLGLSQAELASRVGGGVKQPHIQQLEKGKTLQPRYLTGLARALGVTREWLESGREPKHPQSTTKEVMLSPSESVKSNGVDTTDVGSGTSGIPGSTPMNQVERKLIKALVDAHGPMAVIEETTKAANTPIEGERARPFKRRGN